MIFELGAGGQSGRRAMGPDQESRGRWPALAWFRDPHPCNVSASEP